MKLSKLLTLLIFTGFFCSQVQAAKKNLSPEMEDLIQGPLLNSQGKEVSKDVLAGKTIGIYFSAHWCPPAEASLPSLLTSETPTKKTLK